MAARRYRLNHRFYILLGILAFITVLIVWLVARRYGGTVGTDTVAFSRSADIVVARDENTATSESYGRIDYTVLEGELVTGGQKIAEVYKWGYNDNSLQDLSTLEQQIGDYQQELMADIMDAQFQSIDQSIEEKKAQIYASIHGDYSLDLLQIERELRELLVGRRDYLQTAVQPDERLTTMYDEKSSISSSLEAWRRDVLSTGEGRISFWFDGYEPFVNKQTFSQLQSKDVASIVSGKTLANSADVQTDRPLYRIVNPNEWYAILYTSASGNKFNRLVEGEFYTIELSGFYDRKFNAEAVYASRNKNGGVYAAKIVGDVSPLLSQRTVKGTVSANITGLSCPTKAVKTDESTGEEGLFVKVGSEKQFVPITVLYMDEDKTIFRSDSIITHGVYYYSS